MLDSDLRITWESGSHINLLSKAVNWSISWCICQVCSDHGGWGPRSIASVFMGADAQMFPMLCRGPQIQGNIWSAIHSVSIPCSNLVGCCHRLGMKTFLMFLYVLVHFSLLNKMHGCSGCQIRFFHFQKSTFCFLAFN